MTCFKLPLHVYYEDTDASGVVYHGTHIRYFERSRTEMLRTSGFPDYVDGTAGLFFVVRRLEVEYLIPIRLNDSLIVTTEMESHGKTSLILHQTIYSKNNPEKIFATGKVTMVLLNTEFKPTLIPQALLTVFERA